MKIKICGYLVLRKSEYNFDELGRGAFSSVAPKIDKIYYGGIERMPWFDVDEDFYNKSLPEELVTIRNNIMSPSGSCNDIKLCSNLDEAKLLLDYSNRDDNKNELVAIDSQSLADDVKPFEIEGKMVAAGCDLYCDGYGSIIRSGLFTKPEFFNKYISEINSFGVFNFESEFIARYISDYQSLTQQENLEKTSGHIKRLYIYKLDA